MNLSFLFDRQNRRSTIMSIIYFVVGVLFLILPNIMMSTFETIVCFSFLAYGGVVMFAFCISSVVGQNRKLIFSAVLAILIGILLLFVRSFFVMALALCMLILIIFKSLVLTNSAEYKNLNWYIWLASTILQGIATIIVIIFFALNQFINISMMLIGFCLIIEAVVGTILLIKNQRLALKMQEETEILKENIEE